MTKISTSQMKLLHALAAPDEARSPIKATAAERLIEAGLVARDEEGTLSLTDEGRAAIEPAADVPSSARGAEDSTAATPKPPKGKLGLLLTMLQRPEGTTIDAISEATGWQKHSVRGAISGAIKKKLGFTVTSETSEAGRVYKILEAQG